MKLGAALNGSLSKRIEDARRLGFSGLNVDGSEVLQYERPEKLLQELQSVGLRVSQLTNWYYNPLMPSEEHAEIVRRLLKAAPVFGDDVTVIIGAGGYHPENPYVGHGDNWTPEAVAKAADNIRPFAKLAEEYGTTIALEPHFANVAKNETTTLELLERIGSDHVGVNLDIVNYCTYYDYWNTPALIDRFVDKLRHRIKAIHLKDIVLETKLVVGMREGAPGEGAIDYVHLFKRLDGMLGEDVWAVVEHTPDELLKSAYDYVIAKAGEAGVRFAQ